MRKEWIVEALKHVTDLGGCSIAPLSEDQIDKLEEQVVGNIAYFNRREIIALIKVIRELQQK